MDDKAVLQLIMKRRSIRLFTGEPVSREQLETLLKAAMAAPSSRDGQPWRFIVVTDKAKIKAICEAHPYAGFGTTAGAVIIPFCKKSSKYSLFQDMAAATQNLLLAAAGIGLGATWCGMNEERQRLIKPLVGLPDELWAFAVIPVGVPAERKPPRTQYDERKVFWERYEPTE